MLTKNDDRWWSIWCQDFFCGFHEHLVNQLCKMGFKALKADYDLGYCSGASGDHHEYVATYVDDILALS